MTNDELRNKVEDVLANMDLDEYTNIWNQYVADSGVAEKEIHPMDDFNEVFSNFTPFEVADSLSREFTTGDALFVYDPCYTQSFDHPTDWLTNDQIDGLVDWIMEGNDGGFEELIDLLSFTYSKERTLLTALAITMCEDERCTSCQGGWEVEDLMDECFEWEDGEPVSGCLFGGWVEEVDDNIFLEFNAKTMKYAIRIETYSPTDRKGLLVGEGDLTEDDFLHTDVDKWLRIVMIAVSMYWRKVWHNAEHKCCSITDNLTAMLEK